MTYLLLLSVEISCFRAAYAIDVCISLYFSGGVAVGVIFLVVVTTGMVCALYRTMNWSDRA